MKTHTKTDACLRDWRPGARGTAVRTTPAALLKERDTLRGRLAELTDPVRQLLETSAREWDDHPELTKRLRGLIGEGR